MSPETADRHRLTSAALDIPDDLESACDFLYEKGWTDGLPVIPPTPERIEAMLSGSSLAPSAVVAQLNPRSADATVEKIAINAVMAGCKPEYLPVLVAAVKAMAHPEFNLHAVITTTNSVAPMAVINGPIRHEIGVNCGRNALGPGVRANAAIGRAVKMVMMNVAGGVPQEIDKAILGLPAKYTCCFGEDEEGSPWEPLHVEHGLGHEDSAVTMYGISSDINTCILAYPEQALKVQLDRVANALGLIGSNNWLAGRGDLIVIIPRGWATILKDAGFTKEDLQQALWEASSLPEADYPPYARVPVLVPEDQGFLQGGRFYCTDSPAGISIIVAGAPEPYHVMVMNGYGEHVCITEKITT
jgi:hypothetical protein